MLLETVVVLELCEAIARRRRRTGPCVRRRSTGGASDDLLAAPLHPPRPKQDSGCHGTRTATGRLTPICCTSSPTCQRTSGTCARKNAPPPRPARGHAGGSASVGNRYLSPVVSQSCRCRGQVGAKGGAVETHCPDRSHDRTVTTRSRTVRLPSARRDGFCEGLSSAEFLEVGRRSSAIGPARGHRGRHRCRRRGAAGEATLRQTRSPCDPVALTLRAEE